VVNLFQADDDAGRFGPELNMQDCFTAAAEPRERTIAIGSKAS